MRTVVVPDSEPDLYPYPLWSPYEEAVLRRWYSVLGITQCVTLWESLIGRQRNYKQIDTKSVRMGLQDMVPDDVFELFEGGLGG